MNAIKYLAILPFIGMFIGPILHNSTTPYIIGLPFVLGWIVIWILITSAIMALIYVTDPVRLHETEI
jgi:hypothetical protein